MSEMPCRPLHSTDAAQHLSAVGHAFRGALLDSCAAIETWATAILGEAAARGRPRKAHYLGQKLEAMRELAEEDRAMTGSQRLLKHPDRVIALLAQFRPYAELRASLAHAVQSVAFSVGGEPIFLFAPVEKHSKGMRVALTQAAQSVVLANTRKLAKEFRDQLTRPPTTS